MLSCEIVYGCTHLITIYGNVPVFFMCYHLITFRVYNITPMSIGFSSYTRLNSLVQFHDFRLIFTGWFLVIPNMKPREVTFSKQEKSRLIYNHHDKTKSSTHSAYLCLHFFGKLILKCRGLVQDNMNKVVHLLSPRS